MQEQLRLALSRSYQRKSEKVDPNQQSLFDELEVPEPEPSSEPDITVNYTRKRGKRKPIDETLERRRIEYTLNESERLCECGQVCQPASSICAEQYDYIPAEIKVIEHVQKTYACPDQTCTHSRVVTAPKPAQPIPKSNASPSILAHIVTAKYIDAMPLHRQEKQFARLGIHLPRNTMSRWMITLSNLVIPILALLEDKIRAGPYMQCDETPTQVNKEPGRAASTQSYMWVRRGGLPEQMVILFHYSKSRSSAVAKLLLDDYCGYLQCDGYSAYTALASDQVILVGCFAHARRKFKDALKALSKKETMQRTIASTALNYIRRLYRIEKKIKDSSIDERYDVRQLQSIPLLNEFKQWLDQKALTALPKSPTGKAISYCLNQWKKLIRYCDHGALHIDNNADERAIRPYAIGRRNWVFSDTPEGALANARLYSLIETAKLHGCNPNKYLTHIFKELPQATTLEDIERLLPWNFDN